MQHSAPVIGRRIAACPSLAHPIQPAALEMWDEGDAERQEKACVDGVGDGQLGAGSWELPLVSCCCYCMATAAVAGAAAKPIAKPRQLKSRLRSDAGRSTRIKKSSTLSGGQTE
ncbi:hypothetical protein SAMD00023353_3601000 [Rosellinia necatrix]|uniref:Uncharacterized protein n=1 Tax=Rosellinia necatrix TaxID=77044 RepID=A0A1S8A954_ROSNE|nr:hypothetical protein SAMD00023353_3601000 [Rosellinia necatrix]